MDNTEKHPEDIAPNILEAFHMMWDMHPSPVMLTRPNRTIVAANPAARAVGIEPGGNASPCAARTSPAPRARPIPPCATTPASAT